MEYSKAIEIAIALCYKLQPFTDKLNIAGSVRRGKTEVKDIEICVVPKMITADLFGDAKDSIPCPEFAAIVTNLGNVVKGKPDGRYMQIALPEGINLDLFIPQPHDYYRQYAIRTGSADYSAKIIAGGWKAIGWCGTDAGLRKIHQCSERKLPDGKSKWIPNHHADLPPVWESEEAFFDWIQVRYLKPNERNV